MMIETAATRLIFVRQGDRKQTVSRQSRPLKLFVFPVGGSLLSVVVHHNDLLACLLKLLLSFS